MPLDLHVIGKPNDIVTVPDSEILGYFQGAHYVDWYDQIETDLNKVTILDLAIPAFLDAVPNFKLLLHGRKTPLDESLRCLSAALVAVGPDQDLHEWVATHQPDEASALLIDLFQASTGGRNESLPGFGPARCTKMLHLKRRKLIPIIDSYARLAWIGVSTAPWTTSEMAEIALQLGKWLAARPQQRQTLARIASEAGLPPLSTLRLYDIVQYEYFDSQRRSHGGIPAEPLD